MEILAKEKVFNVDDLFKFAKIIDENSIELDLSSFTLSANNFPHSENVKEEYFSFSREAIEANFEKSDTKIATSDFFKGGNWGVKSFIQDRRMKKKAIIIKK